MSIAVSTVVKPSRLLLALTGGMCACIALAGASLGLGTASDLTFWPRAAAAGTCMGAALAGLYCGRRRGACRIDISADGQMRLTRSNVSADSRRTGDAVRLMPDSTLWPHLLLLRLRAEDGRMSVLTVLPDSVPKDEFRALSVACRWVAAHNNSAENDHA